MKDLGYCSSDEEEVIGEKFPIDHYWHRLSESKELTVIFNGLRKRSHSSSSEKGDPSYEASKPEDIIRAKNEISRTHLQFKENFRYTYIVHSVAMSLLYHEKVQKRYREDIKPKLKDFSYSEDKETVLVLLNKTLRETFQAVHKDQKIDEDRIDALAEKMLSSERALKSIYRRFNIFKKFQKSTPFLSSMKDKSFDYFEDVLLSRGSALFSRDCSCYGDENQVYIIQSFYKFFSENFSGHIDESISYSHVHMNGWDFKLEDGPESWISAIRSKSRHLQRKIAQLSKSTPPYHGEHSFPIFFSIKDTSICESTTIKYSVKRKGYSATAMNHAITTYAAIVERIESIKCKHHLHDKDIANIILSIIHYKMENSALIEALKKDESLSFLENLSHLLYICEGHRSPSAYLCTEMGLSLLKRGRITWREFLDIRSAPESEHEAFLCMSYKGGLMPASMRASSTEGSENKSSAKIVQAERYIQKVLNPYLPYKEYEYQGPDARGADACAALVMRTGYLLRIYLQSKNKEHLLLEDCHVIYNDLMQELGCSLSLEEPSPESLPAFTRPPKRGRSEETPVESPSKISPI